MLLIWSRLPTEQWREVNDHEVLVQGRWTIYLLDRQRYQFLILAQDDPCLELGNLVPPLSEGHGQLLRKLKLFGRRRRRLRTACQDEKKI